MKGVCLAGGRGTRLHPLTQPLNKHTLPIGKKPMIHWVIKTLTQGGVDDVFVGLNGDHADVLMQMLEDGSQFDCSIAYGYKRSVQGPGRTLLLAEKWANNEPCAVILGDSLFTVTLPLKDVIAPHMFVMPLNQHDDPRKYGQVIVRDNHVISMQWKPEHQYSNTVQATCFVFPDDVFERLRYLDKKLPNREVHISDLTHLYIDEGQMHCSEIPSGSFIDCGTHDAYIRAQQLIQ